ncbi:hypothetical protein Franean1_2729 [Parafrankia sp. EAN1pec]|nr:hypothetical protein Franean1_2729 [Frankia sp. EAN1pec]
MWLYDGGRPPWTDAVPSIGTNDIHWNRLVDRGSWKVARGVGRIRLVSCRTDSLDRLPGGRCPAGHRRPCRQEHPVFSAEAIGRPDTRAGSAYGTRNGLSIDDIAELAPAG